MSETLRAYTHERQPAAGGFPSVKMEVARCPFTAKRSYPSKVEAQTAANGMHRRHGRRGDRKVRAYSCFYGCGSWHVGHVEHRAERQVEHRR